jgi:hypothetical protein
VPGLVGPAGSSKYSITVQGKGHSHVTIDDQSVSIGIERTVWLGARFSFRLDLMYVIVRRYLTPFYKSVSVVQAHNIYVYTACSV